MSRNILLMTATITPLEGIPELARVDPKLRLEDYRRALAFYAKLLGGCFDAIIFAENSNSDISKLAADIEKMGCDDGVEFISFNGLDYPSAYGRGYGEFRMVDYAVEHSKLLKADDILWKVTGRYIITNISRIVASRPTSADVYCHMRDYPYRVCELYLLGWTERGYEYCIRGIGPAMRSDIPPRLPYLAEAAFRRVAEDSASKIQVVPRFKHIPVVQGVRGWDNSEFSSLWSPKIIVRRLAHALMPSLWI